MALSQQDRITMSKKMVEIPEENATIDNVKAQILIQQQEAVKADALNAALQLPYNTIINAYQLEYNHISGNKRIEVTETRINNAAKGNPKNGFFLADPTLPIPTVPTGVWKNFAPMSYCFAIGKNYLESYDLEPLNEEKNIQAIQDLITEAKTYSEAKRATGVQCVANPVPPPNYISESIPALTTILNSLKDAVDNWIGGLNAQKSVIVLTETVPTRLAENQAAYNKIDPTIALITPWQSISDFVGGICALSPGDPFYSGSAKMTDSSLEILEDAIAARLPDINLRKSQLNSYFGSITQNPDTGIVTATSGWYGERFLIIDSRLNIISGTAAGKFGAERALAAQNQIQATNNLTLQAYNLTMKTTKAVAPGLDTRFLNVENASDFNVGDRVYVVADNQEELSGSIISKDGNRVELTFEVPKKYTLANLTRMYKTVEKIL